MVRHAAPERDRDHEPPLVALAVDAGWRSRSTSSRCWRRPAASRSISRRRRTSWSAVTRPNAAASIRLVLHVQYLHMLGECGGGLRLLRGLARTVCRAVPDPGPGLLRGQDHGAPCSCSSGQAQACPGRGMTSCSSSAGRGCSRLRWSTLAITAVIVTLVVVPAIDAVSGRSLRLAPPLRCCNGRKSDSVRGVVEIVKGFGVTLTNLFRGPITSQYPEGAGPDLPALPRPGTSCAGTRTGWSAASAACCAKRPARPEAIHVEAAEDDPEHPVSPGERYASVLEVNLMRCVYCGDCETACPVGRSCSDTSLRPRPAPATGSCGPRRGCSCRPTRTWSCAWK